MKSLYIKNLDNIIYNVNSTLPLVLCQDLVQVKMRFSSS